MPTTLEDIRAHMDNALAELGETEAVQAAKDLADVFPDLTFVREEPGADARWGSRDWLVYRRDDGALIGVQYYRGATEHQEDYYEGRASSVAEMEEVTTVAYRPKKGQRGG